MKMTFNIQNMLKINFKISVNYKFMLEVANSCLIEPCVYLSKEKKFKKNKFFLRIPRNLLMGIKFFFLVFQLLSGIKSFMV